MSNVYKSYRMAEFTVLYKNISVPDIDLGETISSVRKILTVCHSERFLLGAASKYGYADCAALNVWWVGCSI